VAARLAAIHPQPAHKFLAERCTANVENRAKNPLKASNGAPFSN